MTKEWAFQQDTLFLIEDISNSFLKTSKKSICSLSCYIRKTLIKGDSKAHKTY